MWKGIVFSSETTIKIEWYGLIAIILLFTSGTLSLVSSATKHQTILLFGSGISGGLVIVIFFMGLTVPLAADIVLLTPTIGFFTALASSILRFITASYISIQKQPSPNQSV